MDSPININNMYISLAILSIIMTYHFSFFIPSFPTIISSVYTDKIFLSVNTDGLTRKYFIGKCHYKLLTSFVSLVFCLYLIIF